MKKLFGNIVLSGILATSIVSIVFAADTKKLMKLKRLLKSHHLIMQKVYYQSASWVGF